MKQFSSILALLLLCAAFTAPAQVAVPSAANAVKHGALPLSADGLIAPPAVMPEMLSPETIGMLYANTKESGYVFRVPSMYYGVNSGTHDTTWYKSLMFGQRFTLPSLEGFLDSAWVYVYELPLGKIRVDAWEDAQRKNMSAPDTNVLYHYPNYWATTTTPIYDSAKFSNWNFNGQGWKKLNFNHTLVPKEFHLTMMPMPDSGISPMVGLVTDARKGTADTINPVDARATILFQVTYGTQSYMIPVFMQGFFSDNTGNPLAPNFYIAAFLEVDMAMGGTQTVVVSSSPALAQNYPNPFQVATGVTEIRFDLPQRGYTTLEVYDAMGRTVRTLASEELDAGSHLRVFDAQGLAAGTYYYRLVSAGRQITRSMLYVR